MKIEGLEAEVYIFVRDYSDEHTHPPTIREIGETCYISRAQAVRYLDKLEAHGFIIREPGKARGITLTGKKPRL